MIIINMIIFIHNYVLISGHDNVSLDSLLHRGKKKRRVNSLLMNTKNACMFQGTLI